MCTSVTYLVSRFRLAQKAVFFLKDDLMEWQMADPDDGRVKKMFLRMIL